MRMRMRMRAHAAMFCLSFSVSLYRSQPAEHTDFKADNYFTVSTVWGTLLYTYIQGICVNIYIIKGREKEKEKK
jgi:hypothetical protein